MIKVGVASQTNCNGVRTPLFCKCNENIKKSDDDNNNNMKRDIIQYLEAPMELEITKMTHVTIGHDTIIYL